jgi:hypothetical protein
MKTILCLSILTLLLSVCSSPCLALIEIADVNKDRARELEMEIRAQPSGPDAVRIELEFPTKGELKGFSRVNLEISDGKKLLLSSSLLPEKESKPGRILVNFIADRSQLDKVSLMVMVGEFDGRTGYMIRVKDFVDLSKLNSIFE